MTVSPQDPTPWDFLRATVSSSESKSGSVPMRSTAATSKTEASSGLSSERHDPPISCKGCWETAGMHRNQGHTGYPPTLRTFQSDCYYRLWDTEANVRTAQKASKGGQVHLTGIIHSSVTLGRCFISLPLICSSGCVFVYIVCCHAQSAHTHSEQSFTSCPNMEHTADQSLSLP